MSAEEIIAEIQLIKQQLAESRDENNRMRMEAWAAAQEQWRYCQYLEQKRWELTEQVRILQNFNHNKAVENKVIKQPNNFKSEIFEISSEEDLGRRLLGFFVHVNSNGVSDPPHW